MGLTNPDIFNSGATIVSSSVSSFELAQNSAGNTINGNLSITMNSTGGSIIISSGSSSSLNVSGNITILHNTSSNSDIYFANNGTISVGGNFSYTNSSSGTNNRLYMASSSTSSVSISGNSTITNSSTSTNVSRIYLGNNGEVVFNGTLDITNSSTTTNNHIYLNHGATSSNTYSENVTLNSTTVLSDGIYFGNSGGNGTLAATKTITIGAGGFIGGNLILRNFTQTGATAQSITIAGTGYFQS